MKIAHLRLATAGLVGALAAACASPTAPMTSGFNTGVGSVLAPSAAAAPSLSGFQINGASFAGDLVFAEEGGQVRATYRHAVDGADLLTAEIRLDDG